MKQQKSKEYAQANYKTEIWQKEAVKCYEAEWNEALKNQWISVEERLPEKDQLVLTIIRGIGNDYVSQLLYVYDGVKFPSDSKYFKAVAWMPIPSFDEILEANKDVLKRLKGE